MIEINQEIKEVNITVEQSGNSITLQPVLLKNSSITIINGGTP